MEPRKPRRISTKSARTETPEKLEGGLHEGTDESAAKKKRKKKKVRPTVFGILIRLIGCLMCLGIMAGCVGGVVLSMYVVQVTQDDEGVLDLDLLKLAQTSILYDKNGEEAARFASTNNRVWVNLENIPVYLQNAVIAIEDKNFLTEPGFNFKRTVGAALNEFTGNALYGSQQGASTIEQQLVKNLTNDSAKDAMRKVREIFRAYGLYKSYSKETILEAYLNTISLTGTICGMQSAANAYFGVDVDQLSLAQCATLACITKNPTGYSPYQNPENLLTRRNYCLGLMRDQGMITAEQCDAARSEPLRLVESSRRDENAAVISNNSYFVDAVYAQLKKDMVKLGLAETESAAGTMIMTGGYRIYTTLDPKIQTAMENIMLNENDEYFPAHWHNEELETNIPVDSEIQYDDDGLPLDVDGSKIFGVGDIPVYTDNTNTELKMGKTKADGSGMSYVTFYRSVRTQAAMATLDYDGNILAVVGGVGQKEYDGVFNRATEPHQTGSTAKPIGAYALGIDWHTITYSTLIPDLPYYTAEDKKVSDGHGGYKSWPENYGGSGGQGAMIPVYSALEQSLNTIAVRIGSTIQPAAIYDFVHDTLNCEHLVEADADFAPIVLGGQSYGISCVELAGAYSIFYDGTFTTPHFYTDVYDYQGNLIISSSSYVTTTQAIEPSTATIMNRMLRNTLFGTNGTARGMAPKTPANLDACAKTGTTSDFKDFTFCGLTPYYVTAVWYGCDTPIDLTSIGHSTREGGKPTQRAWKALMEAVQEDLPEKEFPIADDVVEKHFNPTTGSIIPSGGMVGYYTEDNLPDEYGSAEEVDFLASALAAAQAAVAADASATTG